MKLALVLGGLAGLVQSLPYEVVISNVGSNYGKKCNSMTVDYSINSPTSASECEAACASRPGGYNRFSWKTGSQCQCELTGDCDEIAVYGWEIYQVQYQLIAEDKYCTSASSEVTYGIGDSANHTFGNADACRMECGRLGAVHFSVSQSQDRCYCDLDGDCNLRSGESGWQTFVTTNPSKTLSPTLSPTTSNVGSIFDDPHVTNVKGEHFQLHKAGRYNMFSISTIDSTHSTNIFSDIETINNDICAMSYIRSVQIMINGHDNVRIRRGLPGNAFAETQDEPFLFSVNNQEWNHHPGASSKLASDEHWDLKAAGSNECSKLSGPSQECKHFQLRTPLVDLQVFAGVSPLSLRHYANLVLNRYESNRTILGGLLWDAAPLDVTCDK